MRRVAGVLVGILLGAGFASAAESGDGNGGLEQGARATPLERVKPRYPRALLDRGYEGWVSVSYVVKADGSTADILIEDGSGPQFEESVLDAVKQWRFEPATFAGKPVDQAYTSVAVVFALESPRESSERFRKHYNKIATC